jgi:menaquinone-dependent protoporphyrinogen oxidase
MNVLLVFASTHGHTTRIAQRIARVLRHEGHHVSVRRIDDAPERLDRWDAVVVGGSLHREVHQPELVAWCHRHHRSLAARPNAFFSVSLTASDHTPEAQAATRRCIDRFVEDTEWDPHHSVAHAGCLHYTKYDAKTRWLMQVMMHRAGHPADTSHDFELTDWDEVEEFAHDVAHGLDRMPVAV